MCVGADALALEAVGQIVGEAPQRRLDWINPLSFWKAGGLRFHDPKQFKPEAARFQPASHSCIKTLGMSGGEQGCICRRKSCIWLSLRFSGGFGGTERSPPINIITMGEGGGECQLPRWDCRLKKEAMEGDESSGRSGEFCRENNLCFCGDCSRDLIHSTFHWLADEGA